MDEEEITAIKETVAEDAKEKVNPTLEDDSIAVMAETEGWRLMMKKANKTIVKLLEPIDSSEVSSESNLALIGANTLANAKAIKVLREFVNQAESVKNAHRLILKQQEESKSEA